MQARIVRDLKNDGHQYERDRYFGYKGDADSRVARRGDDVIDGRVRDPPGKKEYGQQSAGDSADELRGDVKDRIPFGNLTEPIERVILGFL